MEVWCRSRTQQAYLGKHIALARVLGDLLMYVDTRDLSLTPHLLMNGFWEMWVTQAICNYVKPGMRSADVGANCGYYTLLLAELVGQKGFVCGIEPQAELCALLRRSIEVSGFGRQAQVESVAVADLPIGIATLYTYESHLGSASVRPGKHAHHEVSSVGCARMDDLGFDVQGLDFVKIDVQGSELEVLRGMKRTLEKSKKIAIAMEFTPSDHEDPGAALSEIESLGLRLGTVGTDGLVRAVSATNAVKPDTGDHRMLWLQKG